MIPEEEEDHEKGEMQEQEDIIYSLQLYELLVWSLLLEIVIIWLRLPALGLLVS